MITFLFGAGADSVYDIGKGASFRSPILNNTYRKAVKSLSGYDLYPLISKNSKKIYIQTIAENIEIARGVFDEDIIRFIEKYQNASEKKSLSDEENLCFKQKCSKWYEWICNVDSLKVEEKKEADFFLDNALFFDSLDEKFNALRLDNIGNKGKRVINAYINIYIHMLKELYDIGDSVFDYTFENIFNLLDTEYKVLKKENTGTYYSYLANIINGQGNQNGSFNIVTTNYTDIAERVIFKNESENHVTYLHGNMKWFEDYRNLTVYDISNENERNEALRNKDHLIPFILIPSGVKPIICTKQIEQFSSFIDKLNSSDYLVVVGYKFNSDDNHINSIIADWLRKSNSKLIYINYNKELNIDKLNWMNSISDRITYNIECEQDIESIELDKKIHNVEVNGNLSNRVFETICNQLIKE